MEYGIWDSTPNGAAKNTFAYSVLPVRVSVSKLSIYTYIKVRWIQNTATQHVLWAAISWMCTAVSSEASELCLSYGLFLFVGISLLLVVSLYFPFWYLFILLFLRNKKQKKNFSCFPVHRNSSLVHSIVMLWDASLTPTVYCLLLLCTIAVLFTLICINIHNWVLCPNNPQSYS